MTTTSDILLSLTRAALWDKVPQLDTALTASTWKDIYFQAIKQAVQGIVHDAICRLPEALLPPDEVLLPWQEEVRLIEATRQQQLMALAWVTSCMEAESSLRPVILKGLPLADLYPTPAHRVSGDIDVFYGSAATVHRTLPSPSLWVRSGFALAPLLRLESKWSQGGVKVYPKWEETALGITCQFIG